MSANNANTTKNVDLKAIRKAEQFLAENFLLSSFYLFCGEIREKGIKEKWDHTARWEAISRWVSEQDLTDINPFAEKPSGIEAALTEWYEKVYLPSKWSTNNYKRYNKNRTDNPTPNDGSNE